MTRTEYLQRPLIKDVVYEITPDKIRVSNTNTVFVEARNCRRLTIQEVRQHFRELQQAAKASGKVRLKGVTRFMPAIRDLYPKYCAACDNIEGRFKELTELVRRMQKDGIHQGCTYDELFNAIIEKRSELTRSKNCDNDYYSQFLYYDKRVCDALRDRPWEKEDIADCTIVVA